MLHAIKNNKTSLYKRYQLLSKGDSEESKAYDEERKKCQEDEITSTVFGPLDFVPASVAYGFWRKLLECVGKSVVLPLENPNKIEMTFWGRIFPRDRNISSIEPDLLVRMIFPNEKIFLLIVEMKWMAELNPKNQLQLQWRHGLELIDHDSALHLFIAPNISEGKVAIDDCGDVWDGRLVLIPWSIVRSLLEDLRKTESVLSRWAECVDVFLHKVGISSFTGFQGPKEAFKFSAKRCYQVEKKS